MRMHTVALGATVLVLAGCGGDGRSAQAVCQVFATQGVALHNAYQMDANQVAKGNPLPSLIDVIKLPNDMAGLMKQMDAVAPPAIEPDFQALSTYFDGLVKNEGQQLSDPIGALGQGLVSSIAVSGSYVRVDSFLQANCTIPTANSSP